MSHKNEASNYLWRADDQSRYKNFIHTTADFEELWVLTEAESQLAVSENGVTSVCVWPKEEFAKRYMENMHLHEQIQCMSIDLYCFMEQLRTITEETDTYVAVFPTEVNSNIISADQLLDDLDTELEKY